MILFQYLSPTGGRLRDKVIRRNKVRDQDGLLQHPSLPENREISEVKETFRGKIPPDNVVLESSPWIRSHSLNIEDQSLNISQENLKTPSPSSSLYKNAKVPTLGGCDVVTESEIHITIDDFNTVFQKYDEFISKTTRQDFSNKISQSSVKFEIPNMCQKTTNQVMMTVPQDFQVFDSKAKSKIKKCKCNKKKCRKNVSSQSFRSVRSCTCSFQQSKRDLHLERAARLKISTSNSTIKCSRDSKHRLSSRASWISKTMRRLRFINKRRKK